MILLFCGLLLWGDASWAQQPSLALVADRDSLGVGDTLEVRVLVDARGRMLTSAGAVVALARGIFVPLSEAPFAGGDFLPGQPYDNAAAEDGDELRLSYVAVSGTAEEGGRLAATGRGELARFWVRAVAPTAGTVMRLEGAGAHRSMYTAPDQPGVEQRFALPGQPLQLRVGGQGALVQPAAEPPPSAPEPLPAEPLLPEAPAQVGPPPNTPPRIAALTSLSVAVGGESHGPLLASFLSDAEDAVEALQVEVAGDAQVAARVEGGRLVVRGTRAGAGVVAIQVTDSQGAWASAEVEVLVRAAGQGPLLRALPKVALGVGEEKVLDLEAYIFDPDTPMAELSWSAVPEGGVEASMAGALLRLRGTTAGPARLSLQVADPEGNVAMAALAVQVEEPPVPAAPVAPAADTAAVSEVVMPDSTAAAVPPIAESPVAPALPDSAAVPADPAASGTAGPALPQEDQAQSKGDSSGVAAGTGESQTSEVERVQASQPDAPAPEEVVTPEPGGMDSVHTDSSTEALPAAPAAGIPSAETPPATSPFAPIVEVPLTPVLPAEEEAPASTAAQGGSPAPASGQLTIEESIAYQVVAGSIDSGLVVDRWVRQGEAGQVRWSLRGGRRLVARLDEATRRLYLDARKARPGREVFFAEAVLGEERRQAVLAIDVRAPRLVLLPFPALELAEGQQLALDLDSYVEGDFAPAELVWTAEAPPGAGMELDAEARVLRLWPSGNFLLRLQVTSPWGNKAEVLLEVRGTVPPAAPAPDVAATPAIISPPPAPAVEAPAVADPQPLPVPPPPRAPAPTDERPPLLWLEETALGAAVELRVRADEDLRAAPVIRVNGQVLEVEGGGGEYRALYTLRGGELQVQVEAEDLAGNAGQTLAALVAHQVQPGPAQLYSPDGRWQVHFPQVLQQAWVLFREEGEAQGLDFDAGRTGPVELVAVYRGNEAPAILRAQGEGWEELPTYILAGGPRVFARSEQAGVFKLGRKAAGALPVQPLVYPNPFNARAAIRYQVEAQGRVRVRVRDGQGRIACLLVDQVQGPGVWTAPWDGRDGDGQGAASGVYFCEVEIAGQRWTGKLLLLR